MILAQGVSKRLQVQKEPFSFANLRCLIAFGTTRLVQINHLVGQATRLTGKSQTRIFTVRAKSHDMTVKQFPLAGSAVKDVLLFFLDKACIEQLLERFLHTLL